MALDSSSWLVVEGEHGAQPLVGPSEPSRCFPSLASAVACSRPGHTILLKPGAPHAVRGEAVVLRHALRLVGGGSCPEAVVLRGEHGLDAVLAVHASVQLLNLSMHSVRGAALVHCAGTLRLVRCVLESEARGLPHLVSQLVTRAAIPLGGRLVVEETRLLGDSAQPVRQEGTGRLRQARAIYLRHQTFAWFEVDAAVPGVPTKREQALPAGHQALKHKGKTPAQPRWAAAFDPDQLQQVLRARAPGTPSIETGELQRRQGTKRPFTGIRVSVGE